jgi:ribosomal protein S25
MNQKKLGIVFLILSIILVIILIQLMGGVNEKARQLGCFEDESCVQIESTLSLTHFIFGIIGFIFALGFYLIFFAQGEEAIVRTLEATKKLEDSKKKEIDEKKFDLIAKGLNEYEKKALKAVKNQDGITQSTLRLRAGMSKAKLSYVLNDLEKKGLITKEKKGKTYAIFLKEDM